VEKWIAQRVVAYILSKLSKCIHETIYIPSFEKGVMNRRRLVSTKEWNGVVAIDPCWYVYIIPFSKLLTLQFDSREERRKNKLRRNPSTKSTLVVDNASIVGPWL
jgi:hypothetical protein